MSDKPESVRDIAQRLRKEGMGCNCDLDAWEPEASTGHSWVCRIHKKALEIERSKPKKAIVSDVGVGNLGQTGHFKPEAAPDAGDFLDKVKFIATLTIQGESGWPAEQRVNAMEASFAKEQAATIASLRQLLTEKDEYIILSDAAACKSRVEIDSLRQRVAELECLVKNLAPTGRYNGLDIEGWYQRAEQAEAAAREAQRDAERWHEYKNAGGELTLRLHNSIPSHRNTIIDAAIAERMKK